MCIRDRGKTRGAEFIVAVPTDITEVEKKAFFDIFYKSKMKPKSVLLCEKPLADAVGLGLDVNEPTGEMCIRDRYTTGKFMIIDSSTRRNLELVETLREKQKRGSLLWVLDKTRTAMGARTLRSFVEQPLIRCV